jgi:hypothetical protein
MSQAETNLIIAEQIISFDWYNRMEKTNMLYHHRQIGHVSIGVLSATLIFLGVLTVSTGSNPITVVVFIAIAICLYLFHSFTIEINDKDLTFFFAHNFWKKKISIREIGRVETVTNLWYYGWGIHLTPNGWLYNVSGLKAVEIQKTDGKTLRIGSDEPEKVKEILEKVKHI